MRGPKLLVVDWDFFFPNPAMSARFEEFEHVALYLWDHSETPFHQSQLVWSNRASGFLSNGLELPQVAGWEGFWDRFEWSEDGVSLYYGDSNLHAGRIMPSTLGLDEEWGFEDRWDLVTLYDAHHDCGYTATGSFEAWKARGVLTCEDWMLHHYDMGSRLEVIYPAWRGEVGRVEPEPLVPVDRRVDDGSRSEHVYDAIYLCRSGAWVPPWCDEQFTAFLEAAPPPWVTLIEDDDWEHPRPDALEMAQENAARRAMYDRIKKGRTA
ncbi:hypothetical protein AB0M39_38260 [Streptomyces sp. NPDC051907]|uniref:hypothetical protein n=1 Tax=Streptomyces sp. NPDC051907 TaxID=3155284 RepID=UPI00342F71F7